MNEAIIKLHKLQFEINSRHGDDWLDAETLMFCDIGGLVTVNFFGMPWKPLFEKFLNLLSEKEVAKRIQSLSFDSPDEGANGTNNFDFSTLAESKTVFPVLKRFVVRLTAPEHHNRTIIAKDYEEEGVVAKLIGKMPNLLLMQIPSAPNAEFFNMDSHPLELLTMQVGFDSQNFINNLSDSTCFKNLRYFDFTDFQETYLQDWEYQGTPFEHFERLVKSKAFDSVKVMILRNLTYSDEQINSLKSIRKNTVFKLIRTQSRYIH